MPKAIDRSYLVGQVFDHWTVLCLTESRQHVICRCKCGKIKSVFLYDLLAKKSLSCKCVQKQWASKRFKKHGVGKESKAYRAWAHMKSRCNPKNKNSQLQKDYVARGILVCPEWGISFETFLKDMGEPPSPKHSLDRIDNNKGYSKENCRWATRKQQNTNRRMTKWVTHKGETLCYQQWAERLGGNSVLITKRIKRGWDVVKAITTPKKQ